MKFLPAAPRAGGDRRMDKGRAASMDKTTQTWTKAADHRSLSPFARTGAFGSGGARLHATPTCGGVLNYNPLVLRTARRRLIRRSCLPVGPPEHTSPEKVRALVTKMLHLLAVHRQNDDVSSSSSSSSWTAVGGLVNKLMKMCWYLVLFLFAWSSCSVLPCRAAVPADVDCIGSPFWMRLQKQVVENVQTYYETEQQDLPDHSQQHPLLDAATARLALTERGCALGKLIACFAADKGVSVLECIQLVQVTYDDVMASRWPVFAFLDHAQAAFLKREKLLERPAQPASSLPRNQDSSGGPALSGEEMSTIEGIPEDCSVSPHPSLEWVRFRRHTYQAVTEAILQLSGHPLLPPVDVPLEKLERSLDEAMDFGSGIVWKSASNTQLDGEPVSYWTNLCIFGVAAATSLRAFGMLLNENDVFRGVERIWQQQAKFFTPEMVNVLLHSRWRWFGLQHAISLLKRVRLDLPRPVLELQYYNRRSGDDAEGEEPAYNRQTGELSARRSDQSARELDDEGHFLNEPNEVTVAEGGFINSQLQHQEQQEGQTPRTSTLIKTEEEEMTWQLPALQKRLRRDIARRNRVVFLLLTADKTHRVADFMERWFRRSRDNGGVALLYEQPNFALMCHAGVREALLLLWKNERHRHVAAELVSEEIASFSSSSRRSWGKNHRREQEVENINKNDEDPHKENPQSPSSVEAPTSPEEISENWSLQAFEDFLQQNPWIYQKYCFPRLSVTTPMLSLLAYVRLALLNHLDAGWLSLHHIFVKEKPFDFFWEADINVLPEFYQPHTLKKSALFVQGTARGVAFVDDLLRMLYRFPFSVFLRVLPRVVFGAHVPDTVPSLSFGETPADLFSSHLPHVHFLDSENAFATNEAWYGEWQNLVLFEQEPHVVDHRGKDVLSEFYERERTLSPEEENPEHPFEFRDHVSVLMRRAQKPVSPRRPVIDLYHDLAHRQDDKSLPEAGGKTFTQDGWRVVRGFTLDGYAARVEEEFSSVERAKHVCVHLGADLCGGVVCRISDHLPFFSGCTIREGRETILDSGERMGEHEIEDVPVQSDSVAPPWISTLQPVSTAEDEESPLVTLIPPGMRFLRDEKLHHVNFAMNCCARDQKTSSDTAVEVGRLQTSSMQNETHLTADFVERNEALLNYHRHPALTIHKTPTAKKGYYVWKAFIFLQALEQAEDDTIVVWSDAGVSFLKDLRPLLARYLRGSDVAACRTVMLEGDWSKRDAFLLTDMDYKQVVESNQIASSLIMARKTPLSLQVAKQWLMHSEDPRIMTEEASVLGYPEYPNYHNNNDDQTAFSLNFKKFGFLAFSTTLRDEYVLLGRNLAKFIANSNAFARGEALLGSEEKEKALPKEAEEVRKLSEQLNKGEIEGVETENQDYYIEAAKLRDDDSIRRHRDGSYEI
ncbi:unnamed protein product [Amoebophrya sp. A120]|nr:unnamed protein product [Amoebophrya sp. A120]|eukprot:GSA120T00000157001.1